MKGLVYKDWVLFYKCIDKKMVLLAAGEIVLLMVNTGVYAGLLASVMLAMTIGMQNVMSFVSDEKAGWKKYQLALPVSAVYVVASRYLVVVCTLAVSLVGSVLLNLISSVVFRYFDSSVWCVSVVAAVVIPLLWTGICLPLTYWFGFRSAQTMGIIAVIPMFYFVKYFEDGAGFSVMTDAIYSCAAVVGVIVAMLFVLSMIVSIAGYVAVRS